MRLTKIDFKNKHGDTISGRLNFPRDQKPLANVLFAHCFTCNKLEEKGEIITSLDD